MARKSRATGLDVFQRVETLARNLWWSWNSEPQRLFAALDPVAWDATNHNPIRVLRSLPAERRRTLAEDEEFVRSLASCERELLRYLKSRTWFDRRATGATARRETLRIAYFSAEFAIHESMPQYAGGLGVLAGDHLKSASDLGVPLVGVGLMYRCGYYRQAFTHAGTTRAVYPEYDLADWPIEDTGRRIRVPLAGRTLHAKVWRLQVGRVPLYLLDAHVPQNTPRDRQITRCLYGGDSEMRIQQELLLGVGGVAALDALGLDVNVFHLNEGHAA
jgi:starch phosphorylase